MAVASALISRGAYSFDAVARRTSRLHVDVSLNEQAQGFVASYTTLDQIEGEVTIAADFDTRFDHVEITFEGECSCLV